MNSPLTDPFRLGEWHVHASENSIVRGDDRVQLEPRVMDLLVFLCRHPDETLGKDEILQVVWGSLHHSDSVIARAVSLLRQHLNDDARNPAYIRTVPSRGYRLIATVSRAEDSLPTDAADFDGEPTSVALRKSRSAPASWRGGLRFAMVALVLLLVGIGWWRSQPMESSSGNKARPSALAQLKTIAIARLIDRDVPEAHRYLLHDIHEAIASALLRRGNHRVLMLPARQERVPETDAEDDLHRADQRGADAVLIGTAVERDARIDVELRLVVPGSRKQLWHLKLVEDAGSEQAFRDGIVAAVTTSLGAALESPGDSVLRDPPVDPRAYRLQAQARWFIEQRSVDGVRKANELFEQAVERDPAYADAFSGLALSFIQQIQYTGLAPDTAFAQAMAAAERALELDPDHSEAITAKALVLALRDWNFDAAIPLLQRALELDPGNIAARQHLAEMQTMTGQHEAALQDIDRALAIKPYSALLIAVRGLILTHAQRYPEALATLKQADLLAPGFSWHYNYWADALERMGRAGDAAQLRLRHHSFLASLSDADQVSLGKRIRTDGPAVVWQAIADHAETYRRIGLPLYQCYDIEQLAANGRDDEALARLDAVLAARGEAFLMLQVSPALDHLRALPAYRALMHKHGVPGGGFHPSTAPK
ncbi:MAG: winged helix-turn-helix domain-containing protein [Xanthomonadales bacterium]|nr:winged helix-turn-helix domain-containing protein [Xanthomonadales bacterium]